MPIRVSHEMVFSAMEKHLFLPFSSSFYLPIVCDEVEELYARQAGLLEHDVEVDRGDVQSHIERIRTSPGTIWTFCGDARSFRVFEKKYREYNIYELRARFFAMPRHAASVIERAWRAYTLRRRLPLAAAHSRTCDAIQYRPGTGIKYFEVKQFFENKEFLTF